MSFIDTSESELYNKLLNKIETIKRNIINIRNYSEIIDNNKSMKYLEDLKLLSLKLNNLLATSVDLYEEYILNTEPTNLSNQDKNKRNELIIEKTINHLFMPYMLYMQILLSNSN